jgi:hypothetical protein
MSKLPSAFEYIYMYYMYLEFVDSLPSVLMGQDGAGGSHS